MKCNICKEGDMIHQYVLYDVKNNSATVVNEELNTALHIEVGKSVEKGNKYHDGKRIVHVYNCQECPNSQLEYYEPEDSAAYLLSMTQRYEITQNTKLFPFEPSKFLIVEYKREDAPIIEVIENKLRGRTSATIKKYDAAEYYSIKEREDIEAVISNMNISDDIKNKIDRKKILDELFDYDHADYNEYITTLVRQQIGWMPR